MGTIRNKMIIIHDYDRDRILKVREDAVSFFEKIVKEEDVELDVNTQMISPVLQSVVNGEFSFVIMGDCSKNGLDTAVKFEKARQFWITENRHNCYKILLVDFGEEYSSRLIDY